MKQSRFEVSTEGMAELQAGRQPWQLVKELVSNAWDETARHCDVTLKSVGRSRAEVSVFDDGPGFSDIADAWTLMKYTPKRANPEVRGRFNIGEKEILSVAIEASINTAGKAIIFPSTGGRVIRKSRFIRDGTMVTCTMPWSQDTISDTERMLRNLLPPEKIEYTVNGNRVLYMKPDVTVEDTLDTVLAPEGPGFPLRNTRRKTKVHLHFLPAERQSWLYEMGVPVQEIDGHCSVDVQQKVPMPPNRDVVRASYLQDIYRVVLNNTPDIKGEESEDWVRSAVEDPEADPESIKKVLEARFGEKVLLRSSDSEANERAERAGFTVVDSRLMSRDERSQFAEHADLVHASDRFGSGLGPDTTVPRDKWTPGMVNVAQYSQFLAAELLKRPQLNVSFYSNIRDDAAARGGLGGLSFNIFRLGHDWFNEIGPNQTGLILHELTHCLYVTEGHNWKYHNFLEELAGAAVHLALDKGAEWQKFLSVSGMK